MSDTNNLKEKVDDINVNFEKDLALAKLKEELSQKFREYQMTMKFMMADAPIEILCLNHKVEKILLDSGFLRVYDLFDVDLTKVKGLGAIRIRELTTRLDQFFSML